MPVVVRLVCTNYIKRKCNQIRIRSLEKFTPCVFSVCHYVFPSNKFHQNPYTILRVILQTQINTRTNGRKTNFLSRRRQTFRKLKRRKAYAGLGCAQLVWERNSFVIRRHHSDDVFLWSEVELGDAFKALLQMRLDAQRVFCLGQDFQQLVIGQEKESNRKKWYIVIRT